MVKTILRIEGVFLFFTALYVFHLFQGNWILFIALLFVPDVSMIGYLRNKRLGATLYNLGHNYVLGLLVLAIGLFIIDNNTVSSIGVILLSHVAMDRFFGYGLKYETHFKDTHLQKV